MTTKESNNIDGAQTVELFLHGNKHPQVVSARLDETLRDLLVRFNFLSVDEQIVFIGEAEEAIHHPTEESDVHEPANIDSSIESLELHKHKHVHISEVHRVEVTIFYNGSNHKRRFSPAATIATVTTWAKERFHVDPNAGADLILALKPSDEHPRQDQHLGELLEQGSCDLAFNLVREITPQG